MSITSILAKFNDVSLLTVPGLSVIATDPYRPARRKLNIFELSRMDAAKINSAFYRGRDITVTVIIQRENRAFLESSIDSLMSLLQGYEKDLVLSQSIDAAGKPTVRRYTATYADTVVRNDGGSFIELDLVFTCSDRFGYETGYTILVNQTGITASSRTDNIGLTGSAPWQVPIITLKYTVVPSTTGVVTIGNNTTGQAMTISTGTWANNDLIIVDSRTKTVTVNGTEVVYGGAIPEFESGRTSTLAVSDSFASRTYNNYSYYYKRFV